MVTDKMVIAAEHAVPEAAWRILTQSDVRRIVEASESAREVPAAKTFEEAFAETGYQYGDEEKEGVRLGWELAQGSLLAQRPPAPQPVEIDQALAYAVWDAFRPQGGDIPPPVAMLRALQKVLGGAACPSVAQPSESASATVAAEWMRRAEERAAERDALQRRLDEAAAEHARVCGERDAAIKDRDTASKEWAREEGRADQLEYEREKVEARCTELDRERADAIRYLATAQERVRELESDRDNWRDQYQTGARILRQELADTKARLSKLRDACEIAAQKAAVASLMDDRVASCEMAKLAHYELYASLAEATDPAPQPEKRWEDLTPEEQEASDLQRFGVLPGAYEAPQPELQEVTAEQMHAELKRRFAPRPVDPAKPEDIAAWANKLAVDSVTAGDIETVAMAHAAEPAKFQVTEDEWELYCGDRIVPHGLNNILAKRTRVTKPQVSLEALQRQVALLTTAFKRLCVVTGCEGVDDVLAGLDDAAGEAAEGKTT